ncbi:hypothetical protein [Methylobacterium sp. A54F]
MPALDRDRFAKCQTMWKRGATKGERAAGKAAATRVAASARMSLQDAVKATKIRASAPRYPASAAAWAYWSPPSNPGPTTVAEMMARKADDLAVKKRAARRAEREMRKFYAQQEAELAVIREQQAVRDREWAASRTAA